MKCIFCCVALMPVSTSTYPVRSKKPTPELGIHNFHFECFVHRVLCRTESYATDSSKVTHWFLLWLLLLLLYCYYCHYYYITTTAGFSLIITGRTTGLGEVFIVFPSSSSKMPQIKPRPLLLILTNASFIQFVISEY